MEIIAKFINEECEVSLIPDTEWEQKLLGAIAKGGNKLQARVDYKSEGHVSYGKCAVTNITLTQEQDNE